MIHQENYSFSKTFVDELFEADFDRIPKMFRILMTNALKTKEAIFFLCEF